MLIDPPPPPAMAPTPAEAFARGYAASLAALRDTIESQYNGLMQQLWGTATGLNLPIEERLAALGTRGAALFQVAGGLRELLVAADPTAADRLEPIPSEYAPRLTFNPDGSVSLAAL